MFGFNDTETGLIQFEEPKHLEYLIKSILRFLIVCLHLVAEQNRMIGLMVPRNLKLLVSLFSLILLDLPLFSTIYLILCAHFPCILRWLVLFWWIELTSNYRDRSWICVVVERNFCDDSDDTDRLDNLLVLKKYLFDRNRTLYVPLRLFDKKTNGF